MLSREFLESKVNALLEYWKENKAFGWGGVRCDGVSFLHEPTQVYETESGGLRFVMLNLIRGFHGHYECVVNIDTFDYSIKQHSGYGSLTSTTPPKDHKIYRAEDLSGALKLEMEATIALTIINSCFDVPRFQRIGIVDKDTQKCVFGRIESDNLLISIC